MIEHDPGPFAPAAIAELLAAFQVELAAECAALPEPVLRWRPEPEAWCVLDVVGHLSEAEERGFAGRVRTLLATDGPIFAGWDPPAVAQARRDGERPPVDVLAEFADLRAASVALVRGLSPEQTGRTGTHPDLGPLSMGELLHEWVHHDREHLHQILTIVQDAVWPGMGATQRFSRRRALTVPDGPR